MARIFIITLFFVISSGVLYAQQLSEGKIKELVELQKKIEGTYQVQMINTRAYPSLPVTVYEEIEKRRQDDTDTYYNYNKYMRILILSRKKIRTGSFQPLTTVTYIQ